jgi:hypothetical protein
MGNGKLGMGIKNKEIASQYWNILEGIYPLFSWPMWVEIKAKIKSKN